MKTKIILCVALLSLNINALAQRNEGVDETAIRQVIQYYFDGMESEDIENIRKAFHPKAKWLTVSSKEDLREITLKEVEAAFRDNRKRNVPKRSELGVKMEIAALDVAKYAAFVKVKIIYAKQVSFETEYLTLEKFPNGWRIVSKVGSANEDFEKHTENRIIGARGDER